MNNSNKRLGRGLEALLGEGAGEDAPGARVMQIEINRLDPNPDQPRKDFDETALSELAESIKAHGIIQPILVCQGKGGRYTIVAGERRWRAARLAGLQSVPAILRDFDGRQSMEIALIENLQRLDLNPVEQAEAIRFLMDAYTLTQEQVADKIGKSRPAVANALRLLSLPPKVLEMLRAGAISAGHARALLSLEDWKKQEEAARLLIKNGMSVRQAEKLVSGGAPKAKRAEASRDADIVFVESRMCEALGTKVCLNGSLERGKITIEYFNKDDLDRLYSALVGEEGQE